MCVSLWIGPSMYASDASGLLGGTKNVTHFCARQRQREHRRCSCSLLNRSQRTHSHTSGSRCHSSGQSSISSCHTHISNHHPVCIPPLLCRQNLQGLQDCNPMGCRLKNTQTPGDEILCVKIVAFSSAELELKMYVWKENTPGENMVIIGCQTVTNIEGSC